ncbi:tRNA dihydrouridine synthase DusB [Rickettsiales bacterium]|nr:tRNA dihydrouridine synthase DusB [Rickettsiales bacterium]
MSIGTIKIGDIAIDSPVVLAPMSGVTDKPFRQLVKRFGAGLLVSEMIACRAMIMQTRQSMQKREVSSLEDMTSVQIIGNEHDVMAEAAKLNEDLGAKIIDINFGCPVRKVINGYAGSALMRDEYTAKKILESVVNAVKIPVTLKMRTGWDDNNRNAPALAKAAEDIGIKMIVIHGRTRCQMYKGHADWEFIKQVKDAIKIPLIVNGDIKTYDDLEKSLAQSGADGAMVGRGAYGKPWIINQFIHYMNTGEKLPDPDLIEQKNVVLEHYEDMLSHYGIEGGVRISRKHIGWYSTGLHGSSEFRNQVNKQTDPEIVKGLINDFYDRAIDLSLLPC